MGKKNWKNRSLEQNKPAIDINGQAELIDFDHWYGLREDQIPGAHKKEIIMADFKARKVSMTNTMEAFDEALKKYGIKL